MHHQIACSLFSACQLDRQMMLTMLMMMPQRRWTMNDAHSERCTSTSNIHHKTRILSGKYFNRVCMHYLLLSLLLWCFVGELNAELSLFIFICLCIILVGSFLNAHSNGYNIFASKKKCLHGRDFVLWVALALHTRKIVRTYPFFRTNTFSKKNMLMKKKFLISRGHVH